MRKNNYGRSGEMLLHLMLIPGVVLLFIFNYIPMAGIVMAFQKYLPGKGILGSEWIGLKNFYDVFSMPDTKRAIINTFSISGLKLVFDFFVPILFALLLNEVRGKLFKRGVQTLVYLPHFLSWVILSGVIIDILSPSTGIINQIITFFGGEPIFFLADNNWFVSALVTTHVWKEFGWKAIVFLATLTGIDPTLYEAAMIDGAGRLKQTWYITLPGIMPVAILVATLSLGQIVNAGFDQVFNLYSPVVYQSGDIIDTLVYRIGVLDARFSFATAVGLFKSVVGFVMVVASYFLADRFAGYKIF